jgi:lipopolysaccharide/colanic/teichoic acid biosynthesis glycosyltransferase
MYSVLAVIKKMRYIIKYLFDRMFALLGIILFLPVMAVVALVILFRSGRPVIFRQGRAGKDGRVFTIYKFRTMVPNDGTNTVSAGNDPRITREGAALRRWKLDELPELFNVLIADMSFVGPRPDMPQYAEILKGDERRILSLRPGITGPATLKYLDEEEVLAGVPDPVEYNDNIIYPDKVRINLEYLEHFSLLGDLKLIFRTIFRKRAR